MVSCARGAELRTPWWAIFGVVQPALLLGALMAHRSARKKRQLEERDDLLCGPLGHEAFDPRAVPQLGRRAPQDRALERLDLSSGWPETVNGGVEAYLALGGQEASSWSLVVDTRKRVDRHRTVDICAESFAQELIGVVVDSERDGDILRSQRSITLQRLNSLPADSPLTRLEPGATGTGTAQSPRRRHVRTSSHVLETVNLGTGQVEWSCAYAQSHGALLGVRWTTFHRPAWGRGVRVNFKLINADSALEQRDKVKALQDIDGSETSKLLALIPGPLIVYMVATAIFAAMWGAAMWWAGDESATLEVAGRVVFAVAILLAWLVERGARYSFLPDEVSRLGDLDGPKSTARRLQSAFDRIARFWRTFDYSAQLPLSAKLRTFNGGDRLDDEKAAFAVHCQDRLIQEAFVTVAEQHNIDMSEFKEGIPQINNYGVIASHIHGPVATGDGAQATQSKTIREKALDTEKEQPKATRSKRGAA
jgi:hypothetical protein